MSCSHCFCYLGKTTTSIDSRAGKYTKKCHCGKIVLESEMEMNPDLTPVDNYAVAEIKRISNELGLSSRIKKKTIEQYLSLKRTDAAHGMNTDKVVPAVIYMLCRQEKEIITLNEIEEKSWASEKEISHTYRLLIRKLNLGVSCFDSIDFIRHLCSKLPFDDDKVSKIEAAAMEIAEEYEKKIGSGGKNPRGVAAAAIFVCCLKECMLTQREITEMAEISETTFRNRYREIELIYKKQEKKE